jgi:hypothetical protein
MRIRGHRERAPGRAEAGRASVGIGKGPVVWDPRASGKGPGGGRWEGRMVSRHRERGNGPGGWGGDARPRASGDTGIVHNKLIIFELATEISC